MGHRVSAAESTALAAGAQPWGWEIQVLQRRVSGGPVVTGCHSKGTHLLRREHIHHPDSPRQAGGAGSEARQRMGAPASPLSKGSKLSRGKKNNARNYSGWQISKLALIAIRVSKPAFLMLVSCICQTVWLLQWLFPRLVAGARCSIPWGHPGVPTMLHGTLSSSGATRKDHGAFQESNWCRRMRWECSAKTPPLWALKPAAALCARYKPK